MPKRREISSSLYRDYKYTTITNFKGIDNSQNAFESDIRTASEAVNVYLDEKNILATRPRFDFERYIPISVSNTLETAYLGKFIFHKYFEDIRLKKINSDEYLTGDLRIFTVKNDLDVITTHIDYTYGGTKYRTTLTGCTEINDVFINGESLYVLIDKPYKVNLTYDNGRHKFEVVDDAYYIPTTKTYTNFLESTEQDVEAPNLMSDKYKIDMNVNLPLVVSKFKNASIFEGEYVESDALKEVYKNIASGYDFKYQKYIGWFQKYSTTQWNFIIDNHKFHLPLTGTIVISDISSNNYTFDANTVFILSDTKNILYAYTLTTTTENYVTTVGVQVHSFEIPWSSANTETSTAITTTGAYYTGFFVITSNYYIDYLVTGDSIDILANLNDATEKHTLLSIKRIGNNSSREVVYIPEVTGYKFKLVSRKGNVILVSKELLHYTTLGDRELYILDMSAESPALETTPIYSYPSTESTFKYSVNTNFVLDDMSEIIIDVSLLSEKTIGITELKGFVLTNGVRALYDNFVGYIYTDSELYLDCVNEDDTESIYKIADIPSNDDVVIVGNTIYLSHYTKDSSGNIISTSYDVYNIKDNFVVTYLKEYNTTYNTSFDSMITYKNNYLYYSTKGNHICISINNDPLYLAETTYSTIGDSSPIVACLGISDSYYAIFKRNRTYGASISTLDDFGNIKYMAVSDLKTPIGCIAKKGAIVTQYSNMPLLVYIDGIYGIYQQENVLSEDHIFTKMSSPIDILFGDEDLKESLRVYNMNYWTIFSVYNRMYILDNRSNNWFYWETPVYNENQTMALLDFYTTLDDVTHVVTTYGYEYKLSSHDEDVVSDGVVMETNYVDDFATYNSAANKVTVVPKKITWKWTSQIIPLKSINYDKTLYTTKFMMVDNDEDSNANEYTFDYSIDVYRRHASSYEYKRITRSFNDIVSRVVRTYIPSLTYLKLTLTNEDNDDTYETMQLQDNNQPIIDCRLNLLGLEFKHTLKESKIR